MWLSPLCFHIVNVALPFACIVSLQDLPSNIVKAMTLANRATVGRQPA